MRSVPYWTEKRGSVKFKACPPAFFGKFFLDPSQTRRVACVAFRHCQNGMKMIIEQNYCINPKRPMLATFANRSAQENARGIRTKNRCASFRYHSEEEGTAGNISAPKVGHKQNTEKYQDCRVRCAYRIVDEIDFNTAWIF